MAKLFDEPDHTAVARLAKEIGAEFHAEDETRAFRIAWVWPVIHSYPDSVHAWARQIAEADGVTLAFEAVLRRVRDEISAQDCDNGWATDPAGSALEHVALALQPNTRWLAHAAQDVWRFASGCRSYNEIVALSERAWLRSLYDEIATRLALRDSPSPDTTRGR